MDIKDSDTFYFYLFVFFLDGKLMRILKLSIYELISRENNIKMLKNVTNIREIRSYISEYDY